MSSADLAVLAIAIVVPVLLLGRRYTQMTRGQPFTRDELIIAVGVLFWAGLAFVVFRSPTLAKWVPSLIFLLGGLYLFATQRGDTQSSRRFRLIGGAAAVLGLTQFVLPTLLSLVAGPPP